MKLPRFALLLSLLALPGCAYLPTGSPEPIRSAAPGVRSSQMADSQRSRVPSQKAPGFVDPKLQPYSIRGVTYWPMQSGLGYDEVGTASWYGPDFHGKKTATGETYDMFGISAAHKTLPLGTKVRVTNLANGRETELVINDRGPFIDGRIIDLSYATARLLGMAENGVAKVRVVGVSDNPALASMNGRTGAPAAKSADLASAGPVAHRAKPRIIERDIVEEPARPQAQAKPQQPVMVAEAARPRPVAKAAPAARREPASEVGQKAAQKTEPKAEQKAAQQAESGKYSVQVGAFAQDDNARRVQQRLVQSGYGNARITRVVRGGKEFLAVKAGSFEEREKAEEALRTLKMEFPASFISSGA